MLSFVWGGDDNIFYINKFHQIHNLSFQFSRCYYSPPLIQKRFLSMLRIFSLAVHNEQTPLEIEMWAYGQELPVEIHLYQQIFKGYCQYESSIDIGGRLKKTVCLNIYTCGSQSDACEKHYHFHWSFTLAIHKPLAEIENAASIYGSVLLVSQFATPLWLPQKNPIYFRKREYITNETDA